MEYSYRFRIYPTRGQEDLMQRTFGCCRYVYNHFLDERINSYRETGKAPNKFQQIKEPPAMKKEREWMKEVDSTALQASVENLDTAYKNFFGECKRERSPVTHDSKVNMTIGRATKANA